MYKAIKVRLYPDTKQIVLIAKTLGCVRFVYNYFLSLRIKVYNGAHASLSYDFCSSMLTTLKKRFPFLKEVDSAALQQALRHLDKAYENFFEERADFPVFKKKGRDRKYSTICTNNNIRIEGGYLVLPKIGSVKMKLHRSVPDGWRLTSATIERTPSGKYYASIRFSYENQVEKVSPVNVLGLDYSSAYLYIDSNGDEPDCEKQYRKYEDRLAKEQRKLSKMQRDAKTAGRDLSDCRNYQKHKRKVAKIHEKIANCRKDALHKLSKQLAGEYDAIGVEDLNLHALAQSLNLGKSTLDNGYGMFIRFLEYKLEDRGKQLVRIDKWFPSTKRCSCCGNIKPMRLSDREYVCPECGVIIDRDHNSAINIREEAIRLLSAA